jgi:hypothetical protein
MNVFDGLQIVVYEPSFLDQNFVPSPLAHRQLGKRAGGRPTQILSSSSTCAYTRKNHAVQTPR